MKISKKHISIVIQISLVLVVFVYIIIRANSLSFTHDEAFSYKFLIGKDDPQVTANHHILNTNLMALTKELFGKSELSLRLPNVLAFILYALGYFLITLKTEIKHSWLLFFLYFFNPFVLDFFSLARGYGLSMGFVSISLYGCIRIANCGLNDFIKYVLFALIFGSLALFSNLSIINYYLVVVGYILFLFIKNYWKSSNKKQLYLFFGIFVLGIIPIYFVIDRLLYLKGLNELYFGAKDITEMVNSLSANSFYGVGYPEYIFNGLRYFIYLLFFTGLLSLLMHIKLFYKHHILLIFPLVMIGYFLEFYFFDAKLPLDRTLLYLYVLFLFFLAKSFKLIIPSQYNKPLKLIGFAASILALFHFTRAANFTSFANWKYDANTSVVMREIKEISEERSVSFSANWLFEPSINYYQEYYEINMPRIDRRGVRDSTEFIYEMEREFSDSLFQEVYRYEVSETVFAKKKIRME